MTMIDAAKPPRLTDNATGIAAMLASMAAFTLNDSIVKLAGARLPLGEVIVMRNGSATLFVLAYAALYGGLRWPKAAPIGLATTRTVAEILSTICFLSALIAMPFADATAIGQFLPIAITAAAVLLLGERASPPLWLAMIAGFIGVLMIVRPGSSAFSPAALLVLAAVGLVTIKELATRQIGMSISTLMLSLLSTASVIVSGLVLLPFETWVWPAPKEWLVMLAGGLCLAIGQALSVVAMVHGSIAVVQPFRYSAIPFALLIGWLIWGQWPDAIQLAGILVLVLAGLYTLQHQRSLIPPPGPPA